jgi:hypothetical protein
VKPTSGTMAKGNAFLLLALLLSCAWIGQASGESFDGRRSLWVALKKCPVQTADTSDSNEVEYTKLPHVPSH